MPGRTCSMSDDPPDDAVGDGTSTAEATPYTGAADDERPDWWRAASATFEAHGLVEYQPPRFADGTVIYEVITSLEADLGVEVDLVGYGQAGEDEWFVRVDGARVAEIDRQRRVGGKTIYDMAPDAFEVLVREAVTGPDE